MVSLISMVSVPPVLGAVQDPDKTLDPDPLYFVLYSLDRYLTSKVLKICLFLSFNLKKTVILKIQPGYF